MASQTHGNWEVVVSDDGSNDKTHRHRPRHALDAGHCHRLHLDGRAGLSPAATAVVRFHPGCDRRQSADTAISCAPSVTAAGSGIDTGGLEDGADLRHMSWTGA
ncbi:MAG: glycosyltransferase [Limnohabitans sp.]|nr:glycosyltransferase [Limnohabitans sp.]